MGHKGVKKQEEARRSSKEEEDALNRLLPSFELYTACLGRVEPFMYVWGASVQELEEEDGEGGREKEGEGRRR